jgi:hypothetical protein
MHGFKMRSLWRWVTDAIGRVGVGDNPYAEGLLVIRRIYIFGNCQRGQKEEIRSQC